MLRNAPKTLLLGGDALKYSYIVAKKQNGTIKNSKLPATPSQSPQIGECVDERREIAIAASFVMIHKASVKEVRCVACQWVCDKHIELNGAALMLLNKGSFDDNIVSSCRTSIIGKSF